MNVCYHLLVDMYYHITHNDPFFNALIGLPYHRKILA